MKTQKKKSKIIGRIKGFVYNTCVDLLCICLYAICVFMAVESMLFKNMNEKVKIITSLILALSILILLFGYTTCMDKKNKPLKFFKCYCSFLFKNRVWINMCIKREKNKDKRNSNRQWAFMKEMNKILCNIPDGYIVYCTTHEKIVEQILKKYPDAEITEAYKKDISRYEKKLLSKDEKKKLKKNKKKKITQFYAVKFTK